ncbi:MAG: hypothetical protein ACOVMH_05790 [Flavobacterium sp.]|jgi:predicted nucleotide-binding protein (sugar kinase/HSP70/actin superfamily)
MDELELLKKDWKKKEQQFKQVSEQDIYHMLHQSSSSIVKWIFIISIIEFLIFRLLDFTLFFDEAFINRLKSYHIYDIEKVATVINFIVLIGFIIYFYKNLKNISTTSSVKKLMKDIIETRKIVKYYVWYNLAIAFVTGVIILFSQLKYDSNLSPLFEKHQLVVIFIGLSVIVLLVGVFYLFYKLVYGILLKRLQNNYKELKKIDL